MKRVLFLVSVLALAAVSCNKEPEIDYDKQDLSINATIAATKTSVTPEAIQWVTGDNITVSLDGEAYIFKTNEQGAAARFTPEDALTQGDVNGAPLAAYYGCDAFGSFTLPQIQTIVGGASRTGVPMYAYTMNAPEKASIDMTFKPVASAIEFAFLPFDITVNKIELAPVDESKVNGSFSGQFSINPVNGNVTAKSAIHSATALFSNGLNISKGASFLFPIGWFTVEDGIKVTITYNDTNVYEDIIFADAPFQSFEGNGSQRSYKFIHQDIELSIGPRDWFVKPDGKASAKGRSWDEATTLDAALANADAGSVIKLAGGEYTPSSFPRGYEDNATEFKTFEVSKGVKIVAADPTKADSAPVLNGNGVYHTMIVTAKEKVEIEGITIKGGAAAGDARFKSAINDSTYNASYAGGLYAIASDLSLKNVTISGNTAATGAGAYILNSKVSLDNVTVDGNTSAINGGGLFIESSEGQIDGSTFSNNISTGGISAGLYIYAAAGRKSSFTVSNSVITKNKAQKGNCGGLDIRGGSAAADVNVTLEGCEISDNYSEAQAGGFRVINAKVSFKDCRIINNEAKTNGSNLVYEVSDVTMDNCLFSGNKAGLAAAIYQYSATGRNTLKVTGCQFTDNTTAGRGGAIYTRAAHAEGARLYVANTTINGNTSGSTGSAIALYGAAATPAEAYVFSSTLINNTCTRTQATPGGAIGLETAGLKAYVYNSIVSGNTWAAAAAKADVYVGNAASSCTISNSIIGTEVRNDSGAAVSGVTFDPATMLTKVTDSNRLTAVYKLTGSGNPALTYGLPVADLKTLGGSYFTDAVLGADQWSNSRTGNVIGAYVAQ